MGNLKKAEKQEVVINIIIWSAIWGIFEATVGYLLHLISFAYSWLIWYPAACFFMMNVYRKNGRISSVFFVALLSAAVKMLNLLLPGRIDKVINPAVSIVLEAIAMVAIVYSANYLLRGKNKGPFSKALMVLGMNSTWRLLYALYLFFLVPEWIRDISVISSTAKFIPFFITQNLISSVIVFIGYQLIAYIIKPLEFIERRLNTLFRRSARRTLPILPPALAALALCINIALQFILR